MVTQFDEYKQMAFSHVLAVMGEDAVWESSTGAVETGRILFKYPTQPENIGSADTCEYPPETPSAEWFMDTFTGLKELSDTQNDEYLIIRGERYFITKVETKVDGDTYIASLEKVKE